MVEILQQTTKKTEYFGVVLRPDGSSFAMNMGYGYCTLDGLKEDIKTAKEGKYPDCTFEITKQESIITRTFMETI